jgi:iron uptake system EfeUOB component EfeO/EfeM
MRRLLFSVAIATASLATGCSKDKADKAEVKHDLKEMTVDEVAAGLEAKQLTAVDCNSDKTRKRVGILPGAILIADEETFSASDLPADKATKLVFYCGGPG